MYAFSSAVNMRAHTSSQAARTITTDDRRRRRRNAVAFVLFAVLACPLLQPVDGQDDDDHNHHHHGSTGSNDDWRPSGQGHPFKILQNVETGTRFYPVFRKKIHSALSNVEPTTQWETGGGGNHRPLQPKFQYQYQKHVWESTFFINWITILSIIFYFLHSRDDGGVSYRFAQWFFWVFGIVLFYIAKECVIRRE